MTRTNEGPGECIAGASVCVHPRRRYCMSSQVGGQSRTVL